MQAALRAHRQDCVSGYVAAIAHPGHRDGGQADVVERRRRTPGTRPPPGPWEPAGQRPSAIPLRWPRRGDLESQATTYVGAEQVASAELPIRICIRRPGSV